jgi:hypothetical protein
MPDAEAEELTDQGIKAEEQVDSHWQRNQQDQQDSEYVHSAALRIPTLRPPVVVVNATDPINQGARRRDV